MDLTITNINNVFDGILNPRRTDNNIRLVRDRFGGVDIFDTNRNCRIVSLSSGLVNAISDNS